MSRENVELIRRGLDAFNRVGASGDLTGLVQVQREIADPAIEYIPVVEGRRICGYEDLLDYWQRWFEPWKEIRWDLEDVTRVREFLMRDEALEAVGLRE